ncbi:helix-turn-helix domain-containing protein [Phascolarctobacterium faecium]|jgi:transcriptional regulator with XRE-family HTH domain|uniref:helix-turn-helix domain-containing protein n=1 Tax=Phascolarctobacterium faecium TaxID=33025 RepID=UPI0026DBCCF9|nr:helix-turn-helix transcriptional regulator [Phascolarctobacterium faecium]
MTREEFIKQLIKQNGYNIKSFAAAISIPYSTLLSMLNNSIGGASVESAIKICEKLNIPVEILKKENFSNTTKILEKEKLNTNEKEFIKKYRQLTAEQQGAIENSIDYYIKANKKDETTENGEDPFENKVG